MNSMISVIVPIYNTEAYLEQCIQSILHQTHSELEIILLNDISDESIINNQCRQICLDYQKRYKGKIQFYEGKFLGPSDARNLGIEHARGNYIYFMDSDDYCEKTLLESLYQSVCSQKCDMGVCGYVEHKAGKWKEFLYGKNAVITDKEFFISLLEGEKLGNYVWNKLFRREIWKDIRFPSGEIFEDISTVYRVVMKSRRIAVVNQSLYHYLRRIDSTSNVLDGITLKQQYCAIRKRNIDILAKYPELYEKVILNQLKYNIVIWNQLCKKYTWKELQRLPMGDLSNLINEIHEWKRENYLRKLQFKYKIMGYWIDKNPELYAKWIKKLSERIRE